MHGNRGRLPASAVPLDIKNKTISLYINDFKEFDAPKEAPKKEKKKYLSVMLQNKNTVMVLMFDYF